METLRKRQSSYWLLILGIFILRETQAELHSLEVQVTVVASPETPPEIFLNCCLNDHLIIAYDSLRKDLIFKLDRTSAPLQNFLIQQNRKELLRMEGEVQRIFKERTQYYNWTEGIHTGQVLMNCETERGILVESRLGVAFDGEDVCQLDVEKGQWRVIKAEAEDFCPYWKDNFWAEIIRRDCPFFLSLLLQIVHLKENTPPEVTVSRHDTPDGSIIFSCFATGFYPHSILLYWEKDGKLGMWGQENSTGTLPNADATYYLHVTLELPPGDTGEGYACLVEHSELEEPIVCPVPGERRRSLWTIVLSSIVAAIFVLSSLAAFIMWKKKKTGMTPLSQLECTFPPISSSAAL
ncbi:zinc-alpha-2-glycoprotein-like [Dromiciops gliroides]|uniref:zinc-alpha-2-glycoprotein-like n=1 Tax=Dromiciops gliroides TaxID=33562 RepID=UPI001CC6825C|nr:zinc-alpha-2-glycoprotein-like [Dromiciops gliroides]